MNLAYVKAWIRFAIRRHNRSLGSGYKCINGCTSYFDDFFDVEICGGTLFAVCVSLFCGVSRRPSRSHGSHVIEENFHDSLIALECSSRTIPMKNVRGIIGFGSYRCACG